MSLGWRVATRRVANSTSLDSEGCVSPVLARDAVIEEPQRLLDKPLEMFQSINSFWGPLLAVDTVERFRMVKSLECSAV